MKKITIFLIILLFLLPLSVYSQDPANKAECISMLGSSLKVQCNTIFGKDRPDMLTACLDNIDEETEKQCDRFFGSGDFCSICTTECIQQYKETDPTRIECLDVCLKNPACKKR